MRMTGMAVMVAAAASGWASAHPSEARHLTICLGTAPGSFSMIQPAKRVVSGVFSDINVRIEWHNRAKCPVEAIYVSFSSQTPVEEHRGALAYTRPYEGTHIVVFLDRVRNIGYTAAYAMAGLLGYVLAHEVAHLLEGEVRHSETGIMKGQWGADEYFKMGQGKLGFAAEDVRLIHKGLDWRVSRAVTASELPEKSVGMPK